MHVERGPGMEAVAVVMEEPGKLALSRLELAAPQDGDVVVDIEWSGISTGTERLLWTGRMPEFPGMGYPLVPGYESVGRVAEASRGTRLRVGDRVFVPGATCFGATRGLFGGAASRVVVPAHRVAAIDEALGERGVLLALAATAHHALSGAHAAPPGLIVGHGILGRLLARVAIALGHAPPTVWERRADRMAGAHGYRVLHPDDDPRTDYAAVYDASGDAAILDALIARLAVGGEAVLAGFYDRPVAFAFPPAFTREARIRIAAEWKKPDIEAVDSLLAAGRLSLDDLITHRRAPADAALAYETAFNDPACLKMVLDWTTVQ